MPTIRKAAYSSLLMECGPSVIAERGSGVVVVVVEVWGGVDKRWRKGKGNLKAEMVMDKGKRQRDKGKIGKRVVES